MIGLGLDIPDVATLGGGPYIPVNSQTVSFFGRLATQPTKYRAALYDALIGALVTAGVWSLLDVLYLFAAADSPTALTNLISSSFTASVVSAPTFAADHGFAGNGSTSYVTTNYDPSTASGQFTLNSAHFGLWDMTGGTNNTKCLGGSNAGSSIVELAPHYNAGAVFGNLNDLSTQLSVSNATNPAHWLTNRTSSVNATLYQNGASVGNLPSSGTAATIPTGKIWIGGLNHLNGTLIQACTQQISCACLGGGLSGTQITALYNAVHTYLQAVAGIA